MLKVLKNICIHIGYFLDNKIKCECGHRAEYTGCDPGWPAIGHDEWTCKNCGKVT